MSNQVLKRKYETPKIWSKVLKYTNSKKNNFKSKIEECQSPSR